MAFSASLSSDRPGRHGRNRVLKYNFTQDASDFGAQSITTPFAKIYNAQVVITSHYNAPLPKVTISEPTLTLDLSSAVDGFVIVEGRGHG
jgi:hypothetical protein